jgi:hypothetical protein
MLCYIFKAVKHFYITMFFYITVYSQILQFYITWNYITRFSKV